MEKKSALTGRTTSAQNHSSDNMNRKMATARSRESHSSDSMLQEFFIDELKDIYWAEKQLVKTLPKLKKAATSERLQIAFTDHLSQTEEHVVRLERVFEIFKHKPQAKKCEAMAGITEEGESIIEETKEGTATRDVALIMAGQKAEHYEIATYGGLVQLARTLGQEEAAEILEATLEEEKRADFALTTLAEEGINDEAYQEEPE